MKDNTLRTDVDDLSKPKSRLKWVVLILACLSLVGDYYCFDNPGALHMLLSKRFEKQNGVDFEYIFNLMYSVYSLPNIILPLLGGLMIFKFGNRIMFLLFGFCVLIGQLIFAFGVSTKSIVLMLTGRVIFGLGGEGLNTTQNILIIQWFDKNELAFALGVCLSMARFGSVLNDVFSPRIASASDVSSSIWFGFAVCSMSFLCTILLVYIDLRQDLLIQMREIVTTKSSVPVEKEETNLSSLKSLSKLYYYLCFFGLVMYGGILPFNYIASSYLIKAWYNNEPTNEASEVVGVAMGLPFFISTILIPLLGLVIDKFGQRGNVILFSSILGFVTFSMFLVVSPILPLVLLGITYSLFASILWPAVTMVVPRELLGIALGFCSSLQNLGLVFFPLFIAYLFTQTKSYEVTMVFFIIMMTLGIMFSLMIKGEDKRNNYILNSTQDDPKEWNDCQHRSLDKAKNFEEYENMITKI